MPKQHHRSFGVLLTSAMVAALSMMQGNARGFQDAAAIDPYTRGPYYGANKCLECHLAPTIVRFDEKVLDWTLLTEYSTWRTIDKHSMAYAVLVGPRGLEMGEKLGIDVTRPESGCFNCHAQNFPDQELKTDFSYKDGVNCEVCHGPLDIEKHTEAEWRLLEPSEKRAKGMTDLRDPATRAELCLSCHVGNAGAGRVVTHPMYAAGHPPLPSVDVARFVKNIPQHWRDMNQVPWWKEAPERIQRLNGYEEGKLFETELTMVGNMVALRESMKLLAERADLEQVTAENLNQWPELSINPRVRDDPRFQKGQLVELAESRWPEMAMTHSDCLACHHELKAPGWRQRRGFPSVPGRPLPRSFPLALIELSIDQFGTPDDLGEFQERLDRLIQSFTEQPFGNPRSIHDAAASLSTWSEEFRRTRLTSADFGADAAERLLARLCELNGTTLLDYDSARQVASAFQVIFREWAERMPDPDQSDRNAAIEEILARWDATLNLGRYPGSEQRDALSLSTLRELSSDPELDGLGGWVPDRLGFPGDPEVYWLASRDNPVLDAFGKRINATRMRETYVSDSFSIPLQKINNQGLRIALDLASDYDPYLFQAELVKLHSILNP